MQHRIAVDIGYNSKSGENKNCQMSAVTSEFKIGFMTFGFRHELAKFNTSVSIFYCCAGFTVSSMLRLEKSNSVFLDLYKLTDNVGPNMRLNMDHVSVCWAGQTGPTIL